MTTFKEVDMFAHNVSFRVKPHMLSDYKRTFDQDILPLLRRQKGFRDEITFSGTSGQNAFKKDITFCGPGGTDVTAISLWDNQASAEAYNTNSYPEVLTAMARFIEGTPKVQTSDVVDSTFYKNAVRVAA
jgi:hypothetical protein